MGNLQINYENRGAFKIIITVILLLILFAGVKLLGEAIYNTTGNNPINPVNTIEEVINEQFRATHAKDANALHELFLPREDAELAIHAIQEELDRTQRTAMQETLLSIDNIKEYTPKEIKKISKKEKNRSFNFDAFCDVSFTVQVFEPMQGLVTTYTSQLPLVLWNERWYIYTQP